VADSARGGASVGEGSNGGVSESGGRRGLQPIEWWPAGVVVFITTNELRVPEVTRTSTECWPEPGSVGKPDLGF